MSRGHPPRSTVPPEAASDGVLPGPLRPCRSPSTTPTSAGSPVKAEAGSLRGRGARLPPRASCLPPATAFPRGTRRVGLPSLQAITYVGRTYGDACVCRDCKPCRKPGVFVKDGGHNAAPSTAKLHGTGLPHTQLSPRPLGNGHGTVKNTVAEAVVENGTAYSQARHSCAY